MMANRNDRNFRATNGEIATVAGIDAQGRIRLEDGRTIPSDYRQIDYGYAITTHRSQGKSVDAVVISADAMRKELFYVAASRGRESVTVVTSDIEGLRRSIAISGDRQTATELNRRKLDSRQRAYRHSMAWARAHRSPVERKPVAIATEASSVQSARHQQVKGVGYGI